MIFPLLIQEPLVGGDLLRMGNAVSTRFSRGRVGAFLAADRRFHRVVGLFYLEKRDLKRDKIVGR